MELRYRLNGIMSERSSCIGRRMSLSRPMMPHIISESSCYWRIILTPSQGEGTVHFSNSLPFTADGRGVPHQID